MCTVFPEIFDPCFVTELATITPMKLGSGPFGGCALLPGRAVHLIPHTGAVTLPSNPLNDDGAAPPLSELRLAHCAPQKVTFVPMALLWSPITKLPPWAKANTITWVVAVAVLPPSSTMLMVMVCGPSTA